MIDDRDVKLVLREIQINQMTDHMRMLIHDLGPESTIDVLREAAASIGIYLYPKRILGFDVVQFLIAAMMISAFAGIFCAYMFWH